MEGGKKGLDGVHLLLNNLKYLGGKLLYRLALLTLTIYRVFSINVKAKACGGFHPRPFKFYNHAMHPSRIPNDCTSLKYTDIYARGVIAHHEQAILFVNALQCILTNPKSSDTKLRKACSD